jgi:c-di-GMP-binding flagellar brake protein YcgR
VSPKPAVAPNHEFASKYRNEGAEELLHCRTVLEKEGIAFTGILSYAEGNMVEVETSECRQFDVGDIVKLTIHSQAGDRVFESRVIAKDRRAIMCMKLSKGRKPVSERREYPRVKANLRGTICRMFQPFDGGWRSLSEPIKLQVFDVSVGGVGFMVKEEHALGADMLVYAELELDMRLPCQLKIVRRQPATEGAYYGAKYVDLPVEKANTLRAFVFRRQVEEYFRR